MCHLRNVKEPYMLMPYKCISHLIIFYTLERNVITVENAFRSILRSNNILHLCHMKRKRKNEGDEPLKDSTYCCTKTSLKSILRDSQPQFKFEDVVIRCNIIVTEAYQFIRLYCLHA